MNIFGKLKMMKRMKRIMKMMKKLMIIFSNSKKYLFLKCKFIIIFSVTDIPIFPML
jgi:hypothetical protein